MGTINAICIDFLGTFDWSESIKAMQSVIEQVQQGNEEHARKNLSVVRKDTLTIPVFILYSYCKYL